MDKEIKPRYFKRPSDLRKWFLKNHTNAVELWIGIYKKNSDLQSITYQEALDQALCFGWIDGIMKSIDELSYRQRFTPRKTKSNWSQVNIKRAHELIEAGLMESAGLAAFNGREKTPPKYSYENTGKLEESLEKVFKMNKKAWAYFEAETPSYRRAASWWVMSAKREETRQKRLETLIADSANGLRIKELRRPEKSKKS